MSKDTWTYEKRQTKEECVPSSHASNSVCCSVAVCCSMLQRVAACCIERDMQICSMRPKYTKRDVQKKPIDERNTCVPLVYIGIFWHISKRDRPKKSTENRNKCVPLVSSGLFWHISKRDVQKRFMNNWNKCVPLVHIGLSWHVCIPKETLGLFWHISKRDVQKSRQL